jgi:hypothetical protein
VAVDAKAPLICVDSEEERRLLEIQEVEVATARTRTVVESAELATVRGPRSYPRDCSLPKLLGWMSGLIKEMVRVEYRAPGVNDAAR